MNRLTDLENLIKNKWNAPFKLRLFDDKIEFSLPVKEGVIWFPIYRAPMEVERICLAWLLIQSNED